MPTLYLPLDAEIERRLEELGATDEGAKTELARRELLVALDRLAGEGAALRALADEASAAGADAEWGDHDWERLARGEYGEEPEEEGLATPPGWRSPRLASRTK